jgi:hypothetical protein
VLEDYKHHSLGVRDELDATRPEADRESDEGYRNIRSRNRRLIPKPIPYKPSTPCYVFETHIMLDFLRAQMNRHCFLFEFVYSGLGKHTR